MTYQPGSLYDQKLLDELNKELTKERWLDDDKNIFMFLNLNQWMWQKQVNPEIWEPFEMSVAYKLEWANINKQQTCEFPTFKVFVRDLIRQEKYEPYNKYPVKSIPLQKLRTIDPNSFTILRQGRLLTNQLIVNNFNGEPNISEKIPQNATSKYINEFGFLKQQFYQDLIKFHLEKNETEVRRYFAEKWKNYITNNSSTPKLLRFIIYSACYSNTLEQFYFYQMKPQASLIKFPSFINDEILSNFVKQMQSYLKNYKVNNIFYAIKDILLDSMLNEAKELDLAQNSNTHQVFFDKYLLKLFKFATKANFHLILLKLYTNESYISIKINEYLTNQNITGIQRLFPVYFFIQHAFFMSYINNLNQKSINDKKYNLPCGKKSTFQKMMNLVVQDDIRQEVIGEQLRIVELFNVGALEFHCYHFGKFQEQQIQFFQNKDLINKNISFNQFLSATRFDNDLALNPILKSSIKHINTVIQINVKLASIEEVGQISTLNYPFMVKSAYTFKYLSNFPTEDEIVFPSGCYFKLRNVSQITINDYPLTKITIEAFIPVKTTVEQEKEVKAQFDKKEQTGFFKKLELRISVMDNKSPVVVIGNLISQYAEKMKPEIEELFRQFEDKLETFNLLEEGMLIKINGESTSKGNTGYALVKEINDLANNYKVDIKSVFMTNDQYKERVVQIIKTKVIEFIQQSNNYHEINLQLKKLQLISKHLKSTQEGAVIKGIIPENKFTQYLEVCTQVKKKMDELINKYDDSFLMLKQRFYTSQSTDSPIQDKQISSSKDTIKQTYTEIINNFENMQLIKVQLSDHINETNGFQKDYFDIIYKEKVKILKETLGQFIQEAQNILSSGLEQANIAKLQTLLKNFLQIKQINLKNHLSVQDIQTLFTDMISQFTNKIKDLIEKINSMILPILNEDGGEQKEKRFLSDQEYENLKKYCGQIVELLKIHPDIQQQNEKEWISLLALIKKYLKNNIYNMTKRILTQSRELKHQAIQSILKSLLKRSDTSNISVKDQEDVKDYFKQMDKMEWFDKFQPQEKPVVQPRLKKLITITQSIFQKDQSDINIQLQAEDFDNVLKILKRMFSTQEKLNLSNKIQEINQIYVQTLETIYAKILQKTSQFAKDFNEVITKQEFNLSKKTLNNQIQVLTQLKNFLEDGQKSKIYDFQITKDELGFAIVNKKVKDAKDDVDNFIESYLKSNYQQLAPEVAQGRCFHELMEYHKSIEESKVNFKYLYQTMQNNQYEEELIKTARSFIDKQITTIDKDLNSSKFNEAKKQVNELVKSALSIDALFENKISQFEQTVNQKCQAQFQIQNEEIKEFFNKEQYDNLKVELEKIKQELDQEEKKSLYQNTKERILLKKQEEQTQLFLYVQKKLFEKIAVMEKIFIDFNQKSLETSLIIIQESKVSSNQQTLEQNLQQNKEESQKSYAEFNERYLKFNKICELMKVVDNVEQLSSQIKQGFKDNFKLQVNKVNVYKEEYNFQLAENVIQYLQALKEFAFYDDLLDEQDKKDFENSVAQLNEKLKSVPIFKSKQDLEFKNVSPSQYKKIYDQLKKMINYNQKYMDIYQEVRESFKSKTKEKCVEIFEETKKNKTYGVGREQIQLLLDSTDLLEQVLDLSKEFDDLKDQYLNKITNAENSLSILVKESKIKVESEEDIQKILENIGKLKVENNQDQIDQIKKYHQDQFQQKAKVIYDSLKNDNFLTDNILDQFKVLYLYKRSDQLVSKEAYYQVIGNYDQKLITLLGQTASELRKQNLGLSSEYLMEFVQLYLTISDIDEYDYDQDHQYSKQQTEQFSQTLEQIKIIFEQFLKQVKEDINLLNGQELQKDLKFIDKMYQPTVTHMQQSSFIQNIESLFLKISQIKEKEITSKIGELKQIIFENDENKNYLNKDFIINTIQQKISISIDNIKQQVKDKKYEELANFTKQLRKLSYDLQNEIKDLQEKQIQHLKQLQEAFDQKLQDAINLWVQQKFKELIQIINEIIPAEKLFNAIQENFLGQSYIEKINSEIRKQLEHEVHTFINEKNDQIQQLLQEKSNSPDSFTKNQAELRKKLRNETCDFVIKLKNYHDQLHNLKDIVHQCIDQVLKFIEDLKDPTKLPEWKALMKEIGTQLLNIEKPNEGRLAQEIISDFQQFAGLANDMFNKQTGEQGIDYAFNKSNPAFFRGDDLNETSIRVQFQNYEKSFKEFLKYYIMNYNLKDEIPKKAEAIAAELRAHISNSIQFKWTTQQANEKIPLLLAYVFSYWTINSTNVDQEEIDFESLSSLKKPHCIQVLSILRLLGTDSSQQNSFNHQLIQIGTGEGKSVTLAASAVMLSLLGFKVDCVCYSQYLSERDQQAFQKLFDSFGMKEQINYHTFQKLSEMIVNDKGDIRTMTLNFIQQKQLKEGLPQNNQNSDQKRILLIDEVDVFFGKDFYGETYNIQAGLMNPNIVSLFKYIWAERNNDLKLDHVFNSAEYNQLVNQDFIKDGDWEKYIQTEIEKMLLDLKEVSEKRHQYLLELNPDDKQWAIAYKYLDSLSFKQKYGYKTCFAYLQEFEDSQGQKITEKQLNANIMISFYVSFFSYAEIPKKFDLILGVTGTLDSLGEYEKQVIKDEYKIVKMTYTPSIFGDRSKRFDYKEVSDIKIFDTVKQQYEEIIRLTKDYLRIERAIVIFFEDNKRIMQFQQYLNDTKTIFDKDINTLEEKTVSKEDVIKKASTTKQVTLASRSFGRGTDFICRDKALKDKGGTLILQTFLVADVSEEIQIQGRTARQGQMGSYKQILLKSDLIEEFKKTEEEITQWQSNNQANIKQYLSDFRKELSKQKGKDLEQKIGHAKDLDQKAVSYKTALVNYTQENRVNLKNNLYDLQKQIANFQQASTKFHFVFILDDSGSMSNKLPNTNPPLSRWDALMGAVTSFIQSREQQNKQNNVTDEYMSVVQFSNRAIIVVNREKLSLDILQKVKMKGGTTNYNKALQELIKLLDCEKKLNSKYKINVMFMSDGTPDENARDYKFELGQINNDYSELVNIFWTIGFGQEDWKYLQSIAKGLKDGNVKKAEFKQTIDAKALTEEIKKMAATEVVFN